jgi:pimeloyl-ACP methyl ester carboxylesterase
MNANLTGGNHKWIIIGGSYPGALSAWFKSKYPDHVVGAWSSSGVINAIEDFTGYDLDVAYSVQNSTLLCGQKIRFFNDLVDQTFLIGSAQRKTDLINAFGGSAFPNIDHFSFMDLVADFFAGFI